jgi:hypothetical protein
MNPANCSMNQPESVTGMDTNHSAKTFVTLAAKTSRQPGQRNPTPDEGGYEIGETETAPYQEVTDPVPPMKQTNYGSK